MDSLEVILVIKIYLYIQRIEIHFLLISWSELLMTLI